MRFGSVVCAVLVVIATTAAGAPIRMSDLLDEMVSLDHLASMPDPAFTCRQFSSYDRASKSPEEHWFANGDCGHYLRTESRDGREERVMMDADGPGAVVRIWSANPNGTLRIYIDGAETPALEAPMADLLGGKVDGFPEPIAGVRSAGWNLYFPIPYAEHCKITSDEGGFYYHVNYRTWTDGAEVESFSMEQVAAAADRIAAVAAALAEPGKTPAPPRRRALLRFAESIEPGAAREICALGRSGEIVDWRIRLLNEENREALLRSVVVRMTFDGEQTVETPLGDFFGTAPGLTPYDSLPLSVTSDGEMQSRWPMPYRRTAVIELVNHADTAVSVEGSVGSRRRQWTERSCHFHAVWASEHDIPTRPQSDWRYVDVEGAGRFVGNALYVANPKKNWWGEGDEKIYVDGETFPSHFGTGTEDYYGYAWCSPGVFQHAYHNQPRCDGPGNYGHSAVNRWHVLDNIPFTSSFRFDMEVWHHVETTVCYDTVSYLYALPGARTSATPIDPATLVVPPVPEYPVFRVAGAIEGEKMRVVESTGDVRPQSLGDRFSNERHVWWTSGKPGDELVLAFDAEESGDREVNAVFCAADDYAIVTVAVNDDPPGTPIDLYNDKVAPLGPVSLGRHTIRAGENTLTVTITGANPEAKPEHMFGLDYIRLDPPAETP